MEKEIKLNDLERLFPNLEFDEGKHEYHVEGKKLPSVSSLISNFYEPFNIEGVSKGYAKKHGFNVKDVKDAWSGTALIATNRGSAVHLFGENYVKWKYFNIGKRPVVECKQCLGVVQFWDSLPAYIIPVALELKMYSKKYGYCGTADILLYNTRTFEYYLADYKTNESLTSLYGNKPLFYIPEEIGLVQDNFGKYTLQFSFYQILLEGVGISVAQRILIWTREQEDKKLYKTFRTEDVTVHLKSWLISE